MSTLLEARRISASYRVDSDGPRIRAVDDVSLTLEEGEALGVAGESGCGKSTLASILSLNVHPPLQVTGVGCGWQVTTSRSTASTAAGWEPGCGARWWRCSPRAP
ncbi:MAG: ATP-binding cassette domain-containing protein [Limnochordaceae bacterium]|nr:ATP-binding cassette domain-containing protein [Limnochordaceae bacterium]